MRTAQNSSLMGRRNAALMELLASHRYDVLRLRKTTNGLRRGIESVQSFPNETYLWDSQALRLRFTPRERTADLLQHSHRRRAHPTGPI